MKTYFICLCLIVSSQLANAATQAILNQDKPSRLYVKSYGESENYLGASVWTNYGNIGSDPSQNLYTNVETSTYVLVGNMSWLDGLPGVFTQDSYFHEVNWIGLDWTEDNNTILLWPQSWWPNVSGTETVLSTIVDVNYPNLDSSSTNIYVSQPAPIYQEHCDINLATNWNGYSWGPVSSTANYRREAQTAMKLQAGGKAVAHSRNLFRLAGSAVKNNYTILDVAGNLDNTPKKIPTNNIVIGNYGNLNAGGVLYISLPDNADVDVTPCVANVDDYTFALGQNDVQTKADWQQVVQYEIDNDSGVKIETYAASSGFMTNRANIQAVYSFYQKLFTEQPAEFYWAGLAKLAGAPVYAGLSDAQHLIYSTTNMDGGTGTNVTAVTNFVNSFQVTLISMNIAIMNDLAWQFEAYRKDGLGAIQTAYAIDNTVLDPPAISAWQKINQGVQQNIITNIQAGNELLLNREQQQILQFGYSQLNALSPLVTWGMSQFAQNPVPGGPDFITMEPGGNIGDFNARWDWINHTTSGMWWLWLGASPSTQLGWVQIPLVTHAADYVQFTPVY